MLALTSSLNPRPALPCSWTGRNSNEELTYSGAANLDAHGQSKQA